MVKIYIGSFIFNNKVIDLYSKSHYVIEKYFIISYTSERFVDVIVSTQEYPVVAIKNPEVIKVEEAREEGMIYDPLNLSEKFGLKEIYVHPFDVDVEIDTKVSKKSLIPSGGRSFFKRKKLKVKNNSYVGFEFKGVGLNRNPAGLGSLKLTFKNPDFDPYFVFKSDRKKERIYLRRGREEIFGILSYRDAVAEYDMCNKLLSLGIEFEPVICVLKIDPTLIYRDLAKKIELLSDGMGVVVRAVSASLRIAHYITFREIFKFRKIYSKWREVVCEKIKDNAIKLFRKGFHFGGSFHIQNITLSGRFTDALDISPTHESAIKDEIRYAKSMWLRRKSFKTTLEMILKMISEIDKLKGSPSIGIGEFPVPKEKLEEFLRKTL